MIKEVTTQWDTVILMETDEPRASKVIEYKNEMQDKFPNNEVLIIYNGDVDGVETTLIHSHKC